MRTLYSLPLLLLVACGHPEGTEDGECLDNIDNDEDGVADCEDEDCGESPDCTGPNNVRACEDWLDAVSCGEYDFHDTVDCSVYAETDCNIVDYFECLTDNTVCDEETGVPDMSGWGACTDYASCG